jgi:hypothetical protein
MAAVAVEQGALASEFVAACFRPQVTMKVIERALSDEGTRERSMLFKAFRYLSQSTSGGAQTLGVRGESA